MSRPPLHALLGFITAARLGNLTRAAESMHLTVSALSHQIRSIEERMEQQLFERGARGVKLTDDGRALYDSIKPHLDAIEHALQPRARRRDDALAITLMPSFASSWLVPRLPRLLAAHPQLEISLQSNVGVVDFAREATIDAGIRFGPGHWQGLQAVHLFDDWLIPTASPALIERLGRPTLSNLHEFPLLGAPGGRWSEWFARFGGVPPERFVAIFDDSENLHRAAAEGMGIVLGRVTLARPLIDAGRLIPLFEERLKAEYAHYLVYPPRSQHHRGLAVFREWLLEEAQAYQAAEAEGKPSTRRAGTGTRAPSRRRRP
ncbi:LysR substrate-binding domain-containing protein [Lysobacter niastensis]|uniref:LysR family transcriptional regulator n=1 Tax=Lysobacter niastensis TaxID=380629 RepID=A0ABS0B3Z1_9GAMM|nr:LysR substrate-binding domain-containing protein [Lysobacter niastensis]MBF6023221.1 LysR family transcriptional regulator [Lysobacter niastensis]